MLYNQIWRLVSKKIGLRLKVGEWRVKQMMGWAIIFSFRAGFSVGIYTVYFDKSTLIITICFCKMI